jgi:predicted nucleotidyltransferase
LNGAGDSPQLRVRLPDELRLALHERANREGITVSELARGILFDAVGERRQRATGHPDERLTGPLGRRLRARRHAVLEIASAHGISNVRVFGSVARGEERPDSDVDLLVDLPAGVGLLELGRARMDLEGLLDARIELIPASDLKSEVAAAAAADAVSL